VLVISPSSSSIDMARGKRKGNKGWKGGRGKKSHAMFPRVVGGKRKRKKREIGEEKGVQHIFQHLEEKKKKTETEVEEGKTCRADSGKKEKER